MMPDSELVIFIFGPNCSGKSTLGYLLANRIERCAYIRVDELRYLVVGGLVAYSGGLNPSQAPEAYQEQCWMAIDHAVLLAHNFLTHGFSCVLEGLEDGCRPDTPWIAQTFPGLPVFTVGLLCEEEMLRSR
jgi:hypothetical protein